ncbi:hypothetical protein EJ110_NYTH42953 [Nymphaea thermarum]|nr:hypothetical protein EJ110_NYTH42953 [Nymphaea thermarum]
MMIFQHLSCGTYSLPRILKYQKRDLYNSKRQFQDIKRGTRSVLEYIHEIKNVSDQLAIIGHPVSDKDKVQQALSGLGSEFDVLCTALEVLSVLPSFEDLKVKLIQHEANRAQRQELVHSGSYNVLVTGAHALHGSCPRVWNSQAGFGKASNISPDVQQILMTALSKVNLRQNEEGQWYVDSGAAAHVTGDAGNMETMRTENNNSDDDDDDNCIDEA